MDTIELRGLAFYGYHGALAEERTLGQRFVVDLRLGLDLGPAGRADDLTLTADYGKVVETAQRVVEGEPFNLIEALAEALAARVLAEHVQVQQVVVRVEKPSAPLKAAPNALAAVEIVRGRAPVGEHGLLGHAAEADLPAGSVLGAATLRDLCRSQRPLVGGLTDPDVQIQPNGIDVTLDAVWQLEGRGSLGWSNADRHLADRRPVESTADGWYDLAAGSYLIRLAEVVTLPLDVMAIGRPRSSLCRTGASIHTAVWDAGYSGRSEALLVVYATDGVRLRRGARLLQLVFIRLEGATTSYAGAYQLENLTDPGP
jgi:dUTP pyrophosphatase